MLALILKMVASQRPSCTLAALELCQGYELPCRGGWVSGQGQWQGVSAGDQSVSVWAREYLDNNLQQQQEHFRALNSLDT